MSQSLLDSLLITMIGMAVVFVAMAFVYAAMRLLTALTVKATRPAERVVAPSEPAEEISPADRDRLQAAALAVALARTRDLPPTRPAVESGTPWGDFYRQRQLRPDGRGRIA